MSGKGASEDLPCDVKALVLQLVPPGHPRLQDPSALAAVQGEFLAWVSRFLAFPAVHYPLIFFFQDLRAVCQ